MTHANNRSLAPKIMNFLNSSHVLTFLFFLFIFGIGLGQAARWDLLQQLSMADSYHNGGSLYPNINDASPHGVSPYFPGVALFSLMLREIGVNFYVVEVLILIACLVVLSFFYIQMKICEQILEEKLLWHQFAPFIIAFSLLVTRHWLSYAVEFKPDVISLLFGFAGLSAAGFLNKKVSITMLIFGALLFSGAIIFKQQYVALVVGVLAFCFIHPSRERIFFASFTSFFTAAILYLMLRDADLWFWNVHIFSDDGILNFLRLARLNYDTIKSAIIVLCCGAIALKLSNGTSYKFNKEYLSRMYKSAWFWGATLCAAAALLSALKVGGNAGNTQLAIVLFVPVIFIALFRLPRFVFTTLAWAAIVITLPVVGDSALRYVEASNLRSFVAQDVLNEPSVILTGSNVYFASRHYQSSPDSFDYWAYKDYAKARGLPTSFSSLLPSISVDRLVVENWPVNQTAINSDRRYTIIFQNKLGIVAKRKE